YRGLGRSHFKRPCGAWGVVSQRRTKGRRQFMNATGAAFQKREAKEPRMGKGRWVPTDERKWLLGGTRTRLKEIIIRLKNKRLGRVKKILKINNLWIT
ncbi:MAG: hypothetical protein KC643_23330, partial [Nitrospira sp.]|nr:hypothetical protein [Nitrospira sp.]